MKPQQQRPEGRPGYLQAGASFCAWACLFGLVALASQMIAPQYLDPSHHTFIFIIGTLGMWRYGNAIVHYIRGM